MIVTRLIRLQNIHISSANFCYIEQCLKLYCLNNGIVRELTDLELLYIRFNKEENLQYVQKIYISKYQKPCR